MNRRDFFKLASAATTVSAGGIALLELLAPAEKTFFLPPAGGWNHRGQVLWHRWDIKNWSPEVAVVRIGEKQMPIVLRPGSGLTWDSTDDYKPNSTSEAVLVRDHAYWSELSRYGVYTNFRVRA